MENNLIKQKIEIAISALFSNDKWLLEHDLSEQSITHKLAEHLQPLFMDYNVDCEYNGNIDNHDNERKWISVLKNDLKELGLLKLKEKSEEEKELTERAVFPDIIIHKRGSNVNNLCIIEVKKSTSSVSTKYDKIKLQAYTSAHHGNELKYQIGLLILFTTKTKKFEKNITYFFNGQESD